MDGKDTFVYLAKLSEQAERYEEMVEAMKNVARMNVDLTPEERSLLAVGYKNVIGSRRSSWRILSAIHQKETAKGNEDNAKRIKDYIKTIESEISDICNDTISMLNNHVIPSASEGESIVFFNKMKGDYYRYLAEFRSGSEGKEAADQSLKAYQTATTAAEAKLPATHPIRLGLALNFSVFYYDIMKSSERACRLAKDAFDEAIEKMDDVNDESNKDSTLILQLLQDNLTLWADFQEEEGVAQ